MKNRGLLLIYCFAIGLFHSANVVANSETYIAAWDIYINSWQKTANGLSIETVEGNLNLTPYDFGTLHFELEPIKKAEHQKSFAVVNEFPVADFSVSEIDNDLILSTKDYKFVLNNFTGNFSFYNSKGELLLKESTNKRVAIREDSIQLSSQFKLTL